MSGTRLFVGGLSLDISEDDLAKEFAEYGSVVKIDIKEKKDIVSENVIKRFAFATIDAPGSSINQCIESLNGKVIDGSAITIERAQESFIERLKREREARALGNAVPAPSDNANKDYTLNIDPQSSYSGSLRAKDQPIDDHRSNYSDTNGFYNNNREKDYFSNDTSVNNNRYNNENEESRYSRMDNEGSNYSRRDDYDSNDFYSGEKHDTYDDRNNENNSNGFDNERSSLESPTKFHHRTEQDTEIRKPKPIVRYDPTKAAAKSSAADDDDQTAEDQHPRSIKRAAVGETRVSSDLAFTGAGASFSLLSMFQQSKSALVVRSAEHKDERESNKGEAKKAERRSLSDMDIDIKEEKEFDSKPTNEVSPSKSVKNMKEYSDSDVVKTEFNEVTSAAQLLTPYRKPYKFFMDSDDSDVEENLRWVYKEISTEEKETFETDKLEIMKLITERQRKARITQREDEPKKNVQHWDNGMDTTAPPSAAALATDTIQIADPFALADKSRELSSLAHNKSKDRKFRKGARGGKMMGRGGNERSKSDYRKRSDYHDRKARGGVSVAASFRGRDR